MEGNNCSVNLINQMAAARGGAAPPLRLPFISHLLQHSLRALCSDRWVYSVFWRILPRHYPPPKWDNEAGPFDRNKGNKRNWILVWEDGYCDFVACNRDAMMMTNHNISSAAKTGESAATSSTGCSPTTGSCQSAAGSPLALANAGGGLQPELFFKMSHDVYNYGEGLMGKVAADNSHKWICREAKEEEEEAAFLTPWQGTWESYPRTWEAQFRAGIQTIAIIAVGEGLLQLGSTIKLPQDLDFVLRVQRKFSYLHTIPGFFAQHPPSSAAAAASSAASATIPPPLFHSFPPPPPPSASSLFSPSATNWLLPSSFHGQEPSFPSPHSNFHLHKPDLTSPILQQQHTYDVLGYRNPYGGVVKQEDEAAPAVLAVDGGGCRFNVADAALISTDNDGGNDINMSSSNSKRARVVPSMSSLQALLSKLPAVAATGGVVPRPITTLLNTFGQPPQGGGGANAGGAAEDQLIARLIS